MMVWDYTNGASSVAGGASNLAFGLSTLYSNTNELKNAVGDLHIAVGKNRMPYSLIDISKIVIYTVVSDN